MVRAYCEVFLSDSFQVL